MKSYPMLKVGNLFFPIKDIGKKFTVENTFDVILTQKDFEDFEGKWDDFFNKPKSFKSKSYTKLDLLSFNFYLPKVLWNKLKTKEYKRIWKGTDWLCPNYVMMHSDKTVVVGIDCLKEVMNCFIGEYRYDFKKGFMDEPEIEEELYEAMEGYDG